MNYEIVELFDLSGSKASVYSVICGNDDQTLFDHFIDECDKEYETEVTKLIMRLQEMGERGVRENYVKLYEGIPGDGVCALFDEPDQKLRLYAIRYGSGIILVGGGGHKSKATRTWQDDVTLKKHAELMILISKEISRKIKLKEIIISRDGKNLEGELIFEIN